MQDPRYRNRLFNADSIATYLSDYADALGEVLRSVDADAIDVACGRIEFAAVSGSRIYVVGNGGSAAIADHLSCDLTKGTHSPGHKAVRTQSLVSNVALYSAIANDYGFENVFSQQIEFLADENDILIAVSSSGNSENIVKAVESARAAGLFVIGLSGFSGGRLRSLADAAIHVPADNYGIVEDAHQAIMHVLAQYIAARRDRSNGHVA